MEDLARTMVVDSPFVDTNGLEGGAQLDLLEVRRTRGVECDMLVRVGCQQVPEGAFRQIEFDLITGPAIIRVDGRCPHPQGWRQFRHPKASTKS